MKKLNLILLILLLFCFENKIFSQRVALSFDGTNDYVQSNYAGISGNNARTVEAWIKTNANADPNAGGVQQVITDWGTGATGARFTFNVLFNNAIRIEIQGSGLSGQTKVNDGKWHHVATVFDPNATLKYSLYVDGVLDTAGNISTTINTGTTVSFLIGKRVDNTNYFNGFIDEVRVFNYARSVSQISSEMKKEFCSVPSTLTAYYKLNEGVTNSFNSSNNRAKDYSRSANTGTLYNFDLKGTYSNWVDGASIAGQTTSSIKAFDCNSYTSPSGKYRWTFSGIFKDTLRNSINCDSVISITLTIGRTNTTYALNICDSFVSPKGNIYKSTGYYTETYISSKGCDSIINYYLTVSKSYFNTVNITSCDSFITDAAAVIKKDSIHTETYKTINACDSIIQYQIKINKSSLKLDTIRHCDSIKIDGTNYTSSQDIILNKKRSNGCDSIIKIHLIINQSISKNVNISSCDSFKLSNGNVIKTSGTYPIIYKRKFSNCDSTVYYIINIKKSSISFDTIKACNSANINGNVITESSTISLYKTNKAGCDSIIKLYVKITKISKGINKTLTTLTADQQNANYKWWNCNTKQIVPNENSRTFTPLTTSSYAAIVTLNNCTDTTECILVYVDRIKPIKNSHSNFIFPNPNHGNFKIQDINNIKDITIYDNIGKIVYHNTNIIDTNISVLLPKGIYYIKVQTPDNNLIQKMLID